MICANATTDNDVTKENEFVQKQQTLHPDQSETEEEIKPLPLGFVPGPMDVICARGKTAFSHPGNRRYRKIIKLNLQQYSAAQTKSDKTCIVSYIMDSIREASSSGVGFVKYMEDGRWCVVGEHIAREKIGQSFRDLLHTKYRSSSKAKKLRQKNRKKNLISSSSNMVPKENANTQIASTKSVDGPSCCSNETSNSDSGIGSIDCSGEISKSTENSALPEWCLEKLKSSFWDDDEPIPINQVPNYSFSIVSNDNSLSEPIASLPNNNDLLDVMGTHWNDEPIPMHPGACMSNYEELRPHYNEFFLTNGPLLDFKEDYR